MVYFSKWGIKAELTIFFAFMILVAVVHAQFSTRARDSINKITAVDYQNMLQQLGIQSIRQGANGNDPKAPNAANYDEVKANPYPNLPQGILKNKQ
jgi:hypothetical protein